MTIATVSELVGVVTASRLLEQAQQQALVNELQRQYTDATQLARAIVKRGWLTAFQIKMLANGKGGELVLGQYLLLDILGEGGMGQVFKARQRKLDRIVALKVIRKERLSNPDAVRRFQREMLAASQMAHPNIVLAFDADDVGDRQFIVMEYVEGVDLGKMVKQQGALQPSQACDYAAQAAHGLQHAHERGMVHRDIKPANLLVTKPPAKAGSQGAGLGQHGTGLGSRWGVVKILDMGLARATEQSQVDMSGTLTQAGAVVGTPDFLSPEQARDSRTVDIRSDIYSLGCTLYLLLTGRVPFPGGTGMEKLFKHQLEPPTPVEKIRPELSPAIAAAVGKMMAKNPDERPQTPAEAARLLTPLAAQGKSAAVRPSVIGNAQPAVSATEIETDDAVRRRKRTSGLAGGSPAVQSPPLISAPARRLRLSRSLFIAIAAIFVALVGIVFLSLGGSTSDTSRRPDGDLTKGTQQQPSNTPKGPLDQLNASQIPAADRWPGLPPEVVAVIGQHRFRHWGPVNAGAISPDGKLLATIGGDRFVRVWNIANGEQRAAWPADVPGPPGFLAGASIAFTPNGQTVVAIASGQVLKGWDLNSGRVVVNFPNPKFEGRPFSLSPDGRTVLWSGKDGTMKLVDPITQEDRGELKGVTLAHLGVWSADGKTVAAWARTGKPGGDLPVWDSTGRIRHTIPLGDSTVNAVALSPDGHFVAVVLTKETTHSLKIWNTASGEEAFNRPMPVQPHQMAFVPGGKFLVMALGDRIRVHELAGGQDRIIQVGIPGGMAGMFFSPDGRTMGLLSSWEPLVRLFDVASGKPINPTEVFFGMGGSFAFSPDSQTLVAGAGFNRPGVRLLDPLTGKMRAVLGEGQQGSMLVGISADSKTAPLRAANGLTLWDMTTGAAKTPTAVGGQLMSVACSPGCGTVFTFGQAGGRFWDGTTLEPRASLEGFKGPPAYHLSLSADGTRLVVGEYQGSRVRLWDATTGKEIPINVQPVKGHLMAVLVSPDGKWMAAATTGGMRVWDAAGQERMTVLAEGAPPQTFGFMLAASPTGDSLLAWNNHQMKLCDPVNGKERATLTGLPEGSLNATFSPDGKLLAAADRTGRLILWNAATGSEVSRLSLPGGVMGLTFAPDGRHLATTNLNGTLYILRLAGG